jgi:hypothetical protein
MKNIILASAIAFSSLVAVSAPSFAASTTVVVKRVENDRPVTRSTYRHGDCYVKTVKYRSHGKVVVRKTKVCR